ncbi:MAG TPA: hypothetical protein VEA80_02410 [Vitreimonas sp.]|uniref:hypothetical protein n=1 Tax=Vitreimonas sp. TaxID=3069702 RepID=UPI002D2340AE|nr:hypothetical protein [Vitreimonas sp.]HYD86303.1 hypothetical protein [Vitreimonas sp.]
MKTLQAWGALFAAAALIPAYFLFFTGNPSPFTRATEQIEGQKEAPRPIRRPEPNEHQRIALERVYGAETLDEGRESEHVLPNVREIVPGAGLWTDRIRIVRYGAEKGVYLFYQSDEGNRYRDNIALFSWDFSRVEQHGTEVWLAGAGIASMAQRMPCDVDDDGRPDCYPLSVGRFDMDRTSWRDGFFVLYGCPHWETEGGGRIVSIVPSASAIALTVETECRGVRAPTENLALPGRGSRSVVIEGQFGDGPAFDVTTVRRTS